MGRKISCRFYYKRIQFNNDYSLILNYGGDKYVYKKVKRKNGKIIKIAIDTCLSSSPQVQYRKVKKGFLYFFDKTADKYKYIGDVNNPATISSYGYCSEKLIKGCHYHTYLSAVKLNKGELTELENSGDRLIEIEAGHQIHIPYSYFYWKVLVEKILTGEVENNSEALSYLQGIYKGEVTISTGNPLYSIAKEIKENRYLILNDDYILDIVSFIDAFYSSLGSTPTPGWKIILLELISKANELYNNTSLNRIGPPTLFKAWREVASKYANPLTVMGSLQGYSCAMTFKDDFIDKNITEIFESYFFKNDRDKKMLSHFNPVFDSYDFSSELNTIPRGELLYKYIRFYYKNIAERKIEIYDDIISYYADVPATDRSHIFYRTEKKIINNKKACLRLVKAMVTIEKIKKTDTDDYLMCYTINRYFDDMAKDYDYEKEFYVELNQFDLLDENQVEEHVNYIIGELVKMVKDIDLGISKKASAMQKFVFVVERARDIYKEIYIDEKKILSPAYAAISKKLVEEFHCNGDMPIHYEHDRNISNFRGKYNQIHRGIDCIGFVITGMYILGLVDTNIHYQNEEINGVVNTEERISAELKWIYGINSKEVPWKITTETRVYTEYEYNGKTYFLRKIKKENQYREYVLTDQFEVYDIVFEGNNRAKPLEKRPLYLADTEILNILTKGRKIKTVSYKETEDYYSNGVRNALANTFEHFTIYDAEELEGKDKTGMVAFQEKLNGKTVYAFDASHKYKKYNGSYMSHVYVVLKDGKRAHSTRYRTKNNTIINGLVKDRYGSETKKMSKFYGELKPRKDYYSNPRFNLYDEE